MSGLADFYDTFAWLDLYRDPDSGDSAFHIGTPEEWPALEEGLRDWFDGLDDDEAPAQDYNPYAMRDNLHPDETDHSAGAKK